MSRKTPPESLDALKKRFDISIQNRVGSIINGEQVFGNQEWDIFYPATEEVITTVCGASAEMVDSAVSIARNAFETGTWRHMSHAERRATFYKVAELIEANAEQLAFLQTIETGIPFSQVRSRHIERSAENFRFFADLAGQLSGETYQQMESYFTMTLHEPIGVGVVIAPWNMPLGLASMKSAACLILGNSCIIKPSEYTPLAVTRLVELMHEAGIPNDAVQVLNGTGQTVGAGLVGHKSVDAINFVGGSTTGMHIMENAAKGLKKIGLELGGKSANIIFDTANLNNALDGALIGIFTANGEQCLAGSRILVQETIADEFIAKFIKRTNAIEVGDPFHPKTEMGPIAFKSHADKILEFLEMAKKEGNEILTGGSPVAEFDLGYFIHPIVVKAKSNSSKVCQEEVFGPFATFVTFKTTEEAIQIANNSNYGLVSYVWSDDLPTVTQVAQSVRAGTIWVNTPMVRDLKAPFGGYKHSGIGRDGIPGSLENFCEQKTVMIPSRPLSLRKMGDYSETDDPGLNNSTIGPPTGY